MSASLIQWQSFIRLGYEAITIADLLCRPLGQSCWATAIADGPHVRRQMINCSRSIVGKQDSMFYVTRGQVLLDVTENPGARLAAHITGAGGPGVLGRQSVAIIVGVHQPTKLELFEIPQAFDSLRLGLRPR